MPTQSVQRAMFILKQFSVDEPQLGVSELSRRLGLTKSTVSRLLATLRDGGLVVQDPTNRQYRLGLGLVELSNSLISGLGLTKTVPPYLRHLSDAVGEFSFLGLRKEDVVVPVLRSPGPPRLRPVAWVAGAPLHCTASGKIFLAHMSEEQLSAFLEPPLSLPATQTTIDPDDLRVELERIQQQGFATSFGEFLEGENAIAAPIVRSNGTVFAAMGVAGPAYRFTREKAMASVEILKAIATELSRELE